MPRLDALGFIWKVVISRLQYWLQAVKRLPKDGEQWAAEVDKFITKTGPSLWKLHSIVQLSSKVRGFDSTTSFQIRQTFQSSQEPVVVCRLLFAPYQVRDGSSQSVKGHSPRCGRYESQTGEVVFPPGQPNYPAVWPVVVSKILYSKSAGKIKLTEIESSHRNDK